VKYARQRLGLIDNRAGKAMPPDRSGRVLASVRDLGNEAIALVVGRWDGVVLVRELAY
jgi:hypothetical protein